MHGSRFNYSRPQSDVQVACSQHRNIIVTRGHQETLFPQFIKLCTGAKKIGRGGALISPWPTLRADHVVKALDMPHHSVSAFSNGGFIGFAELAA